MNQQKTLYLSATPSTRFRMLDLFDAVAVTGGALSPAVKIRLWLTDSAHDGRMRFSINTTTLTLWKNYCD